ncbi:family 78 glycoside hydrolase catalytic domain [Pectobacterium sp. LFLA-215]|uniref:family 78 glycoside hydrolase catalytic domain n=1 Tax=Pectobacterium sp. LFLA-215 TaxID=3419008 RepID=UPI003F5B7F92
MLKINYQEENIVVDRCPLFLNWAIDYPQTSFTLSVLKDETVIYTTRRTDNNTTLHLDSLALDSNTQYTIEIIARDDDGKSTPLRKTFLTSNFGQFKGDWISSDKKYSDNDYYLENKNTVVSKTFDIDDDVVTACMNIVGLGFYKLYINGNEVTGYELNTDWTNYDKTIYYDTYEVSAFLKTGKNNITVELGNGWFNPAPLKLFGKYNLRDVLSIGEPQVIADLVIKGSAGERILSTDESWACCEGPYLFNNIYLGETVDFRTFRGRNTVDIINPVWKTVSINTGAKGEFVSSFIPKIKQAKKVDSANIYVVDENELIIDFGKIIAGFINLTITASDNQKVLLTYSENIHENYTLNSDSTLAGFVGKEVAPGVVINGGPGSPPRAEQQDTLICRAGINHFVNKFTYHSFRYVKISGINLDQMNQICAVPVHTELAEYGGFHCSDAYLNQLVEIARETKLNNVHSVLSDCARERLAYGGDLVALAKSQVYQFDSAAIYEKTIIDFINDIRPNGGVPETAPFMGIKTNGTGGGTGPLGWQLVLPYLVHIHYQHYGNVEVVCNTLPFLERQLEYLGSITLDELGACCLGDWGSRDVKTKDYKSGSPALHFTATCFYYYHILLFVKLCKTINLKEKADFYSNKASEVRCELLRRYKNKDGSFADKSQTSYVFAIYFTLVDDIQAALASLRNLIAADNNNIKCGIFGQSFLYEICRQYDQNDVIVKWLIADGGFKGMLNDDSMTLKEFFGDNKNGSCNHAMFSSYSSWMYQGLGGISVTDDAVGSDVISINPCFIDSIEFVDCWHQTIRGRIDCNWRRNGNGIELVIKIPYNLKKCTLTIAKAYTVLSQLPTLMTCDSFNQYFDITDAGEIKILLARPLH